MKFGSLFSGIGGFDLGFERAGMSAAWQCEIDKQAQDVLRRHFSVEVFNDVRTIGKDAGTVDLICGGFPCQDLSIAGKRKGLAGERSGLYFELHRIVAESYPKWVVLENVPGLLSSNEGRDFAVVIGGLTGIIPEVPTEGWGNAGLFRGPVYNVAYRVLDAQFYGLAQRRKRVFIVASLGSGRAAQVLFESEGLPGDIAESSEAGEGVTSFTPASIGGYSEGIGTLRANGGDIGGGSEMLVSYGLNSRSNRYDAESQTLVPVAYNIMPQNSGRDYKAKETAISQNLTTNGNHSGDQGGTYIAYNVNFCDSGGTRKDRPNGGLYVNETDKSNTLAAAGDGNTYMAYNWHRTNMNIGDVSPTLTNSDSHAPAVGVRRLTPTECERLQGFPDGWTAGQADTVRYRQLGNAVAVPVAEWIGKRIMEAS